MNIAIIVPTYNENENILELIERITQNLSSQNIDFKVFIVDDTIQDTLKEIIKLHANQAVQFVWFLTVGWMFMD